MKFTLLKAGLTIQSGIVLLLTTLLIVTGVIVTYTAYQGSKSSIYNIAENMMKEISKQAVIETNEYLKPAKPVAYLAAAFISKNIVSIKDDKALINFFKDLLKVYPQFVNVYFADTQGNMQTVRRMLDGTFSVRLITRTDKEVSTHWQHKTALYHKEFPDSAKPLSSGYNPLERDWYKKAIDSSESTWVDIYIFYSDNKPGISHSIAIYDSFGKLLGVFSIDISIVNLSHFLAELKIIKTGQAFILDQHNNVVALPIRKDQPEKLNQLFKQVTNQEGTKYYNRSIREIDNPLFKNAFEIYTKKIQKEGDTQKKKESIFFNFSYQNENYVTMFMPFAVKDNLNTQTPIDFNWKVGIVLPENDILEQVHKYNRILFWTIIVFFLLVILLGVLLSRFISRPLALLSQQMDDVKNLKIDCFTRISSPLREVNMMTQSFNGMKKVLLSFQKYIPHEVVSELVRQGKEAELGGEKRELTILFSDIADFTNVAESLSPEILVENLSIYFAELSDLVLRYRGTVDKYIGDSVMAFWNAPCSVNNHALLACQAALQMHRATIIISQRFINENKPPFYTRIGLNTGTVVVGNIGSSQRFNYTALGDAVNLSSRLEGLNKYYHTCITISESTYAQVKDHMVCRWLDVVAVKGKKQGVTIYELIAEKDNIDNRLATHLNLYHEATQLYQAQQWQQARKILQELHTKISDDKPINILLERCERFIIEPPPANWSGVFEMMQK